MADFWHYIIGCNVIGVNSKTKRPFGNWKPYQNESISDELHEKRKKEGYYDKGIAVITGKIWRGPYKGKYLSCIDSDNQKGTDEILKLFPGVTTIDELKRITIVEQHSDNRNKAHIYLITYFPLRNRGGIIGNKEREENIPAIEVKSQGKSYVICSDSIHKDGYKYEITGTNKPLALNEEESKGFEDRLNKIYQKNANADIVNGSVPIKELFKEDFIIYQGNNRHLQLLRVMESLIQRLRSTHSLEEIKEICATWNQKHCSPSLDEKEFLKLWDQAVTFIRDNKKKTEGFIEKKINDMPPIFYYADPSKKVIGLYKKSEESNTELRVYSNIIIDAIPKKIHVYKNNPLSKSSLENIKIIFESSTIEEFELGPYDNMEMFIKGLDNKHLVINQKKASEALACIINAHKENKMVENVDGITTDGFYLLGDKIKSINIKQDTNIDLQRVGKCIEFLDHLANNCWNNKKIFPTVLKWALISPFGFSIKFNSDGFFPWLQLYGLGQTGKTTLGNIVLAIWNLNKRNKSIGFNNIDSVARFGYTVSKDTYPILVNEVGPLFVNNYGKYTPILEIIKHAVESITCRGKFFEGKNYQEILAFSTMILTSNYSPPNDGSYNRRFLSIQFPEEEKKDEKEQEEFRKVLEENKKNLSVLGDFAAHYIQENPLLLRSKKWEDIAKEILVHFYELVDLSNPEWLDLFEEQRDAIDESTEKTSFELRAFLINKINDTYAKNQRFDFPSSEEGVVSKLDFCLKHNLISFIAQIDNNLIVTVDIMKELRQTNQSIENLTSLRDVGAQLGLSYVNKNINGKRMRILMGLKEYLINFLNPKVE
jgi:hypothetical protein